MFNSSFNSIEDLSLNNVQMACDQGTVIFQFHRGLSSDIIDENVTNEHAFNSIEDYRKRMKLVLDDEWESFNSIEHYLFKFVIKDKSFWSFQFHQGLSKQYCVAIHEWTENLSIPSRIIISNTKKL